MIGLIEKYCPQLYCLQLHTENKIYFCFLQFAYTQSLSYSFEYSHHFLKVLIKATFTCILNFPKLFHFIFSCPQQVSFISNFLMYYSSYPMHVFLYAIFAVWKSAEFKESVGLCALMDVMYSLILESSLYRWMDTKS